MAFDQTTRDRLGTRRRSLPEPRASMDDLLRAWIFCPIRS